MGVESLSSTTPHLVLTLSPTAREAETERHPTRTRTYGAQQWYNSGPSGCGEPGAKTVFAVRHARVAGRYGGTAVDGWCLRITAGRSVFGPHEPLPTASPRIKRKSAACIAARACESMPPWSMDHGFMVRGIARVSCFSVSRLRVAVGTYRTNRCNARAQHYVLKDHRDNP